MKDPVDKTHSNGVESDTKIGSGEYRSSLTVNSNVESMRSSSSSLAKSESSQDTPVSVLKSSKNTSSSPTSSCFSKKVSIVTEPLAVVRRERDVQSPHGDKSHRASIIQVSADKRAKKVKFYINGDKFFKGAVIAVNNEKFRTFDKLLEHMTKIMCNQVTLPNGVRYIFSLEGKTVTDMDCILNGESYVCSSFQTFKKLDYVSLAGNFCHLVCDPLSKSSPTFRRGPYLEQSEERHLLPRHAEWSLEKGPVQKFWSQQKFPDKKPARQRRA